MALASQGLWCVQKLCTFPNQLNLNSLKIFSSVCRSQSRNEELFKSITCVKNCSTSRKLTDKLFRLNYINGCQRFHSAPCKMYLQKPAHCSEKYHRQSLINLSSYSTSASQDTPFIEASKSHLTLQVKRPVRKKLTTESDELKTTQVDNVVAYAVAEDIDLVLLEKLLVKQGLYSIGQLPQDVTSALHVRGKYTTGQKQKEIFVFEDGSVIFWCVPEVERGSFLKMMGKVSTSPYTSSLMLYEREEMGFTSASGKTCLSGDLIQLKEDDKNSQQRLLEMYAFSNALAQSVKLAMLEASFNKFVDSIENVTEDLRRGRKISMSRQQVLMKTGELFSLRHQINLSSDLLDIPDFYWDREALEPLYISLCNYLSIFRRTKVMNQKLNHCCELTGLLSSHLNDANHTRLEVMIIILIMVEVFFAIVHYLERYWKSEHTETQLVPAENISLLKDDEINSDTTSILVQ